MVALNADGKLNFRTINFVSSVDAIVEDAPNQDITVLYSKVEGNLALHITHLKSSPSAFNLFSIGFQ